MYRRKLYSNDGLLENWQDWEEPDPRKSTKTSWTSLQRKRMLPSMVDRLMTENVTNSVRGVGIPSPESLSVPHPSLRRQTDALIRMSSQPAPRFPHVRTYPGRTGWPPRPERLRREFPASLSDLAYGLGNSRPYKDRVAAYKMSSKPTLGAQPRRRPHWLPPLASGINLSPDRLPNYLSYPRGLGHQNVAQVDAPLICRCCEDINKINMYNQRLGRSTQYPLLSGGPRQGVTMAGTRHRARRDGNNDPKEQHYFSERQERDSDIYNSGF